MNILCVGDEYWLSYYYQSIIDIYDVNKYFYISNDNIKYENTIKLNPDTITNSIQKYNIKYLLYFYTGKYQYIYLDNIYCYLICHYLCCSVHLTRGI